MESGPPLVSVVLPVYEPEADYFRLAVGDVLGQSMRDLELIIVDDGSSTPVVPPQRDDRIRVIRQPNRGVSAARNNGVANARASLVAFMDDDDRWAPTKLERQVGVFDDEHVVLCDTDFDLIGPRGDVLPQRFAGCHESFTDLLVGDGIACPAVMTRRDVLLAAGLFDTALAHCEDWDMWLRLARLGRLHRVPETLTSLRIYGGNTVRHYRATFDATEALYAKYEMLARREGRDDWLRAIARGRRHMSRVTAAQAVDQFRESRRSAPRTALGHLMYAAVASPRLLVHSFGLALRARVSTPRSTSRTTPSDSDSGAAPRRADAPETHRATG